MSSDKRNDQKMARGNPYLGPMTFQEDDKAFFFGRDREAQDLCSLLIAHRLMLFYAESGAGKSSLINAKLKPDLEKYYEFEVLPSTRLVRSDTEADLQPDNIFVTNLMLSLDRSDEKPERFSQMRLADFLLDLVYVEIAGKKEYFYLGEGGELPKKVAEQLSNSTRLEQFPGLPDETDLEIAVEPLIDEERAPEGEVRIGEIPPRLLIIDQFEELFTTRPEASGARKDFFVQISEAMNADPFLHVLLVIREDHLAKVPKYADLVPGELRDRYRMERLSRESALEAIRDPARVIRLPFAEPIDKKQDVVEVIVDNLLQIRAGHKLPEGAQPPLSDFVEPVQLQVVCYELWSKLTRPLGDGTGADGFQTITGGKKEIQWADVEAIWGDKDPKTFLSEFVTDALGVFYAQAIKKVLQEPKIKKLGKDDIAATVSERQIRTWFDTQLITEDQTRDQVRKGKKSTGKDPDSLPHVVVEALVSTRIIRKESRRGEIWYELVHDRFINPIVWSNSQWREEQMKQNPVVRAAWDWKKAFNKEGEEKAKRYYYRDRQLKDARAATNKRDADLVVLEFLRKSEKDQKERRRRRNLLGVSLFSLITVILASIAIFLFWSNSERLESMRIRDNVLDLAAGSMQTGDPDLSILLAKIALNEAQDLERDDPSGAPVIAENALNQAMMRQVTEPFALVQHQDTIMAVTYSPDGDRIATASWDSTAKILDQGTWEELSDPLRHKNKINGVAFSPDGQYLATASQDNTAKIWDSITGEELLVLSDHTDAVIDVEYSPDGTRIVTTSWDNTAKIWDAETGRALLTLVGHTDNVIDATFSPSGQHIATTSFDNTARIWDAETGEEIYRLEGHNDSLMRVEVSPDGNHWATTSYDGTVMIWDANSGKLQKTLCCHEGRVLSVAYHPDGDYVATGGSDGKVKLWDIQDAEIIASVDPNAEEVWYVAFSPDGKHLLSAHEDGGVYLWEVKPATKRKLQAPQPVQLYAEWEAHPSVDQVALDLDGDWLATAGDTGIIKIWPLPYSDEVPPEEISHSGELADIVLSGDGAYLTLLDEDGELEIWQPNGDEPVYVVHLPYQQDDTAEDLRPSITFDPDKNRLLFINPESSELFQQWSPVSSRDDIQVPDPPTEPNNITHLAVSSNGSFAIMADQDGTLYKWSSEKTEDDWTKLAIDLIAIESFLFSPDGGFLAVHLDSGRIRVWNLVTGENPFDIQTPGPITALAFQPHGPRLAVSIRALSSADPHFVYLYDLANQAQNAVIFPSDAEVVDIALNEYLMVTAHSDGTVRLFTLGVEHLQELACQLVARNLTFSEWQVYKEELGDDASQTWICPELDIHWSMILEYFRRGKSQMPLDLDKVQAETIASALAELSRDPLAGLSPFVEKEQDTHFAAIERLKRARQVVTDLTPEQMLALAEGYSTICDLQRHIATDSSIKEACEQAGKLAPKLDSIAVTTAICQNAIEDELAGFVQPACDRVVELAELNKNLDTLVNVCQNSTLKGFAGDVKKACEKAKKLANQSMDAEYLWGACQRGLSEQMAEEVITVCEHAVIQALRGDPYLLSLNLEICQRADYQIHPDLFTAACDQIAGFPQIGPGGEYTGSLVADEMKLWSFPGEQGQIVSISLISQAPGDQQQLSLLDPQGAMLKFTHGISPSIDHEFLQASGDHFIQVSSSGTEYEFTLKLIEHTPRSIRMDQTVESHTDQDKLWSFEGAQGQVVSIDLQTLNSELIPVLTLLEPSGLAIAYGIEDEQGVQITHAVLPISGKYIIRIEPNELSADYSLTLSEFQTEPVVFDQSINSNIAAQPVWEFLGNQGDIVSISVETIDTNLNPIIRLFASDGREMFAVESLDGQIAMIEDFELPESRTYLIIIDSQKETGAYTLIVSIGEQ